MTEHPAFGRAVASLRAGHAKDAEDSFKLVLSEQPKHLAALNLLAVLLTQLGRFADAETYLRRALEADSNSAATLQNYAIVLQALHRPAEALERFSQVLRINSNDAEIWNQRGLTLCALRRFGEANHDFERAIELNPNYAEALCNKGRALATLGRPKDALPGFDRALALEPNFADAWYCRGNACFEIKHYEDARAAFDRALALRPDRVEAWLGLGNACYELKRREEAIAAYDKALTLKPGYAEASNNRATVLLDLKRYSEAIAGFERALRIQADFADAWLGLGGTWYELSEFGKAAAAYEKALSLNPHLVKAWVGRGNILTTFMRYQEALQAFDRALDLDPDYAEMWVARAEVLAGLKRFDEAIVACDRALSLRPELGYAAGTRLNLKLLTCDWTDLEAELTRLADMIRRQQPSSDASADVASDQRIGNGKVAQPMVMARLTDDPTLLMTSAINWIRVYAAHPKPFERAATHHAGKVRLGYISQDFCQHVTGHGVVEMLERHDKERFEMYGFSLTADDGSAVRTRIAAAFDHFHDLSGLGDEAAARRIFDLGIDVLVEIAPLSHGSRPAILAYRPAPIQVNYGPPGYSTGASFMDYIIGDQWTLPLADQEFFCEKIANIPHSWFAHDSTVTISPRVPSRAEEGLPEHGFVFCCFNNSYKITPEFFAIWMRLLREVEGSVLWLAGNNDFAIANLRRAAAEAGIDPGRLVFAQMRSAIEDHLARHHLADLFLDTLPYNAQTTAMDALWAGLPVLTCAGRSFAGRIAQSILHDLDVPELIGEDLAAYERLAIALTRDPQRLRAIRAKVESNQLTTPLFDTGRLCRELEAAYETMVEIWRRGESPRSFSIAPL